MHINVSSHTLSSYCKLRLNPALQNSFLGFFNFNDKDERSLVFVMSTWFKGTWHKLLSLLVMNVLDYLTTSYDMWGQLPINFIGWRRVQGLIFGKISYLIKKREE